MSYIDKAVDRALERRAETDAEHYVDLKADIKALRTERGSLREESELRDQIVRLKKDVSDLEISKSKKDEEHQRKIRETEHRVGLLRTQQEHEVANARRETTLEVREGNLTTEREQFAKDMKFQRERLQGEVDRVAALLDKVLERLPNIEVTLAGKATAK